MSIIHFATPLCFSALFLRYFHLKQTIPSLIVKFDSECKLEPIVKYYIFHKKINVRNKNNFMELVI